MIRGPYFHGPKADMEFRIKPDGEGFNHSESKLFIPLSVWLRLKVSGRFLKVLTYFL